MKSIPLWATTTGRYGWLGGKQRSSEAQGGIVLMGVRLYNPTTGRFLSVDAVPGGNPNAYAYPTDPINMFDLDGRMGWGDAWAWAYSKSRKVQAGVIGLAAAFYSTRTGGSCRYLHGLRTCHGGWGHGYAFGSGSTTFGSTYMAAPGAPFVTPSRIKHEKVHRDRWRRYGVFFAVMYAHAGFNAYRNRYEIEANLSDGGY